MHTRTRLARSLAAWGLAALSLTAVRATAQQPVALGDSDQHALTPPVAHADSVAVTKAPPPDATLAAAPSLVGARAAVSARIPASNAAVPMRARGNLQQSQVLMIVGGAAVVLGILVDNDASDVLIVVGAGVGLWGLYQYLKTN